MPLVIRVQSALVALALALLHCPALAQYAPNGAEYGYAAGALGTEAAEAFVRPFRHRDSGRELPPLLAVWPNSALVVSEPSLAHTIRRMAERSPLVRGRLARIRRAPYPVLVTTREHVPVFDSTFAGAKGEASGVGAAGQYIDDENVVAAIVVIDLGRIRNARLVGHLTERQTEEDVQRTLVHELVVHTGSFAPGRSIQPLCDDPPAGSLAPGCSVIEENLFMRDLGWLGELRLTHAERFLHVSRLTEWSERAWRDQGRGILGLPLRSDPRNGSRLREIGAVTAGYRPLTFHDAVARLLDERMYPEAEDALNLVRRRVRDGWSEHAAFTAGFARATAGLARAGVRYARRDVALPEFRWSLSRKGPARGSVTGGMDEGAALPELEWGRATFSIGDTRAARMR